MKGVLGILVSRGNTAYMAVEGFLILSDNEAESIFVVVLCPAASWKKTECHFLDVSAYKT